MPPRRVGEPASMRDGPSRATTAESQPERERRRVQPATLRHKHDSTLAERPAAPSTAWLFLTDLSRFRLTLGLWSIAAAMDLVVSLSGGGTFATPFRVAATYGCGFGLALSAHHVVDGGRRGISDFSFARMLAVAVPSGTALFAVDVCGRAFAHGQSPLHTWPTAYILRIRPMWAYFTVLFVFQSTVTWLIDAAQALRRREEQLLEARLSALRLQLNPHFLFNTLNAILTLVAEAGATEAERMIARLSEFLQATLEGGQSVMVPLAAEIDMVQAYLSIEEVRFGDRLEVRFACDAGLSDAPVPNFILQPLVENAIKHAVAPSKAQVTVTVSAAVEADRLVLAVTDNGRARPYAPNVSTGLGLLNVANRLEALYGAAARLESTADDHGFRAVVRLPIDGPIT